MLAGRALHARAALYQVVHVVPVGADVVVFYVVLYISVRGLVGYRRNRAGLVNVLFSEDLAHVSVSCRLVFTGEVQVNVRLLVALESEECGERYVEAFLFHAGAALGTGLLRHVVAGIVPVRFIRPLEVPALRADIVRRKRIDLRDARHRRGK